MAQLINDIEFIVGRGQQYDPAAGAPEYRNPALKNKVFRPSLQGLGVLLPSQFEAINDVSVDDYGFNVLIPGFLFELGQKWLVSVVTNTVAPPAGSYSAIIDPSYFIRNVFIAGRTTDEVADVINQFIQMFEPEILQDLMGNDTFQQFIEGINAPDPAQKWLDLLFGGSYVDACGRLQYWMGFSNANKMSILANYVYYNYIRNNNTQTTAGGESVSTTENGQRISAATKAVWAWNEMAGWIKQFHSFMAAHKEDFPDWQNYRFPDWKFTTINVFDI